MHFSPNVMSFFVDKISQDKPEAFGKIVFFIIKYCLNQLIQSGFLPSTCHMKPIATRSEKVFLLSGLTIYIIRKP